MEAEQRADTTPYGDVPYADPGYQPDKKKRYPIDCAHVQAAWSYINQADNQRPYTAEQLSEIKGRIRAAMAKCGHNVSDSGRSAASEPELRYTPYTIEVRAGSGLIGGYAAMFNKPSRNLGGFVEQVAPGAFNESRRGFWSGVVARYDHDSRVLLGTVAAGTLQLRVDANGLDYDVRPPRARSDIVELVERGDIRHSSFAFRVARNGDGWETSPDHGGLPMRSLLNVQLVDVSPVVSPAYLDTTAALRSLAIHVDADVEEVRQRAERDELRSFFVRTDVEGQSKPRKFGTALLAEHLGTKRDPWA